MARKHSDATRAAVAAQLLVGNTPRYVERQTGVPQTTVRRATADLAARTDPGKRAQIGDLLLELVAETVEGAINAARLLSDAGYIKNHGPSEVAILSGTLMDKAFLILAAAERYGLGPADGGPQAVVAADEPSIDVRADTPADPDQGP